MINRILIRIKVVQILYSFFLVEKKFTLEDAPATLTREKRYAYGLYMDMLMLLVLMSESIEKGKREHPLTQTRFLQRIKEDDRIRTMLNRYHSEGAPLRALVDNLAGQVKESGIYKNFLKDYKAGVENAEDNLWREVFNQIIVNDPQVKEWAAEREGYTLKGYERTIEMMNGTLYNFITSQDSLSEALQTLSRSLDKARELYLRLLTLAVDLTDLQERNLDAARHKHLRTEEDLNPNMKFVENEAIDVLRNDPRIQSFLKDSKLNWFAEDPILMQTLLRSVLDSDIYKDYMEKPERSLAEDAQLWRDLFRKVILTNTSFLDALEELSVFWNDDLDVIGDFVGKTFRRIEEGTALPLLDKYKDEEDAAFGEELMRAVFKGREEYRGWINEAVANSQWDAERLAFMDVVVVITALAEILNFPKIPLNVSINEYIEIAKSYSSAKSGQFVHGLLAHILAGLKEQGRLLKA